MATRIDNNTAAPGGKGFHIDVRLRLEGDGELAPTAVYAYTHQGLPLASAPLEKGMARLPLPAGHDGRTIELVLGPPLPKGGAAPDLAALVRAGAYKDVVRALREKPQIDWSVPVAVLPQWCVCTVRGRVVRRFTLPDGSTVERPVCNTRVHVCEVDRLRLVIERLPELDLHRLRDELLEHLEDIPNRIPGPIPEPESLRRTSAAAVQPLAGRALARQPLAAQLPVEQRLLLSTLQAPHSVAHLRSGLAQFVPWLPPLLCELQSLWRWLHCDEVMVLTGDAEGRFSGWLFHDCKDQPDLYVWVEQFRNGAWSTVYRPSMACTTRWNYVCGTEIVIDAPGADACEDPAYDLPPGVTLFVAPWAIGHVGIWGTPPGAPPAPTGMLRNDGLVDYVAAGLGLLRDAPFGGALSFIQDDSWFIPSASTPIRYYRYSVRRQTSTPNTGPGDASWTPLLTPLSRGYRLEYSDRLPTYQGFAVGPHTVGAHAGLFLFKPQQPPNPGGTVVASEWTSGNLSEPAAIWNTPEMAPAMTGPMGLDAAGAFEVKIEVFDAAGVQVMPGPGTFQFVCRNAAGSDTRLATAPEVVAGAYVMRVHVDNNASLAALPQPDIAGVGPNPDCGFLRYDTGDAVSLRFRAAHPNQRAVFGFGVVRGSNGLGVASTTAPYVEVASAVAPTTGSSYVLQIDGFYRHDFAPGELVGACVNAAFAADLGVYGKAMDGWQRIGYDARRLIAFALAQRGS